jgi:hypothetical protein
MLEAILVQGLTTGDGSSTIEWERRTRGGVLTAGVKGRRAGIVAPLKPAGQRGGTTPLGLGHVSTTMLFRDYQDVT